MQKNGTRGRRLDRGRNNGIDRVKARRNWTSRPRVRQTSGNLREVSKLYKRDHDVPVQHERRSESR